MNRPAIPLLLALFSAQTALAQSYQALEELQFYGRANVALHANDFENAAGDEQQDNWTLESHVSVLGIRGGHTLQQDLRAVFQLEYEVFYDDGNDGSGDSSEFRQRNSYLGLEGKWGRVIAGKHDTPLKLAQGTIDRFNDVLLGDLSATIEGENRPDNIVLYTSALRDNWRFRAAFIPGEDSGTDPGDEDGLADGISASAEYSAGKQRFAIAHERGDTIDAAVDYATRLVFEHHHDDYSFGVLVQHAEFANGDDEEGLVLSGEVPLDPRFVAKAQTAYADLNGGHRHQLTLGMDYLLGKNAKTYGYISQIKETVGADSKDITAGVGFKFMFAR